MTFQELLQHELKSSQEFFERSGRVLEEKDSGFTPVEGQYSVAAHVAHAAMTIDWFLEGAFGSGFDMSFEEHDRRARAVTSLAAARTMLAEAYSRVLAAVQDRSEAEWSEPFPPGTLMEGPKSGIVFGIVEHSAHHRGALSVYARLLGKQPLMPYMEM
jgi:uncharacterized damage-inducible protein DinB